MSNDRVKEILQPIMDDIVERLPEGTTISLIVQTEPADGAPTGWRTTHWISNAPREGMAALMRKMLDRWDGDK